MQVFLLNYYFHINREKVQFDFLTFDKSSFGLMEEKLSEYGARVYETGWDWKGVRGILNVTWKLYGFLRKHPYKIIHVNTGGRGIQIACCLAAKMAGVKHRIAHSHNAPKSSGCKLDIMHSIVRWLSTDQFSCSIDAAVHMFGKSENVRIINNAIDVEKYRYNEESRKKIRSEFGLSDDLLIGITGEVCAVKNQKFLVEVMERLKERDANAKLLLVGRGNGEYATEVSRMITEKRLSDRVIMTGLRDDVYEILSALDVFVLPSKYEGLPLSVIEAQANGLPCLVSVNVPRPVDIIGSVEFLPIDDGAEALWTEMLEACKGKARDSRSALAIKEGHYDIMEEAGKLEAIYKGMK